MALLNLSLVTRSLLNLLEARLPLYADWPVGATLTASAAPPGAVEGSHAISLYLYQLQEDAEVPVKEEDTPLRYQPMGLTLNYVLCPNSTAGDVSQRVLNDQLLMGLAVKTLRDYPLIDDTTMVETMGSARLVMPTAMRGRGNRIHIRLAPPSASGIAVAVGTAEGAPQTQHARMAAYYQVTATLLEPREPFARRPRVLTMGVHMLQRGQPRIDHTRNRIRFTRPGRSEMHELTVSPAEVSYGGEFEVVGADLMGERTALLINHRDFAEPVVMDPTWNVDSDGNVLWITARASASGQAITPGIYGLLVRTTVRCTLADGKQHDVDNDSNESTFAIVPGIASVAVDDGLGVMTVEAFDPAVLEDQDVMLFVGLDRLERVAQAPAAGQFRALVPNRIEFRFPTHVLPGSVVSMRLVVRGAESAPRWEVVPAAGPTDAPPSESPLSGAKTLLHRVKE